MSKRILPLLLIVSCIFHFSGKPVFVSSENPGKERYGGIFRMNLDDDFRSLYPLLVVDDASRHIAGNIYEGLVEFDPRTLGIRPSLATSWEISADRRTYTFNLRRNVFFHADDCFAAPSGREMTAADVKFCLDKLCERSANNMQLEFKDAVEGGAAFYESGKKASYRSEGVSGISLVNDSTIRFYLPASCPHFLQLLALPGAWIYPHEAWEKYEEEMRVKCVGTGPFRVAAIREGNSVSLTRNENYWDTDEYGNALPYLDGIRYSFIKDRDSLLDVFGRGELEQLAKVQTFDAARLIENTPDSFAKNPPGFVLMRQPSLSVIFFGFQTQKPPFDDVRVRQAFCMAIDRGQIAANLQDGVVADSGLVPQGIPGYTRTTSLPFNPEEAKKLLAKAGHKDGKKFPEVTLQINSSETTRKVAEAAAQMLKQNLNVTVKLDILPFAQHLHRMGTGDALFWRSGWMADYPDPKAFLSILYGKPVPDFPEASYANAMRYKSSVFDSFYEKALAQPDDALRMQLFQRAEATAIADAAVCPLYYKEDYQVQAWYVRNYHINALDRRDLSAVWFEKKK